jgi:streptomycin 3"-adenylyltransferase
MAQYGWIDCPQVVRQQIEGFTEAITQILADNLSGVYLHGSLAMGCFNPACSDIDLLIVTRDGMTAATLREAARIVLDYSASPSPFELSSIRESYLFPWQYTTPFDFHFSEDWRDKTVEALAAPEWRLWLSQPPPTDPDLAAHVTITRARGICLAGKPILDVFPAVPGADYIRSIMGDFDFAREQITDNPVYAVLNFCRIYGYLREGRIDSKDEAGVWALDHLPSDYHALISAALDSYRHDTQHPFDPTVLNTFAEYVFNAIQLDL